MCAIDDCDDRYDPYSIKDVKRARKEHTCDECCRKIAVGEPYLYVFGVLRGYGGNSHYTCAHCRVAANWLRSNCGGFVHSGVQEDIEQHVEEYPALAFGLSRFIVGMRRQWKRFDGNGLMRVPRQAKPIEVQS